MTLASGELAPEEWLNRAQERGLRLRYMHGMKSAYLADTKLLIYVSRNFPQLLLLPWEIMRKMGFVSCHTVSQQPYTFLSHQWEQADSPFLSDVSQIIEHIDLVETPKLWCDWWCVPQWSRRNDHICGPDEKAQIIFQTTMATFHQLCFLATSSLCIVKRTVQCGLWFGSCNLGDMLRTHADRVDRALEAVGAEGSQLHALINVAEYESVDLEYAARAWCALERCYLPVAEHVDRRLEALDATLDKLAAECQKAGQTLPGYLMSINADAEAVAHFKTEVARLKHVVELCTTCESNRSLYQNDWSYAFLKENVFQIGNLSDYKLLDKLFISTTDASQGGLLFLFGKALHASLNQKHAVEWPGLHKISLLEVLDACLPLAGGQFKRLLAFFRFGVSRVRPLQFQSSTEDRVKDDTLVLADGATASRHGDALHITVVSSNLSQRRLKLRICNLGVCASEPTFVEVVVCWQGPITNATHCSLIVLKKRELVFSDLPQWIRTRSYGA